MGAFFTTRALLGAPYDADALAWRRAVLAQGGTVSAAQLARIARLVRALKARGVWDRLDRLWIFAAENVTQALTDLCTRSLASLSPTPPGFTALRGFIGNATSAYVDLGVAASALTKFTQNAAHISAWVQQGDGATNLWIGASDSGTGFSSELIVGSSNLSDFRIQTGSTTNGMTQGGQTGFHIVDRQGSSVGSWARNGADVDSNKTVSVATSRATSRLIALARNSGGSYSGFSGSRLAAISLGGSLGSFGRATFYEVLRPHMTAVGA